MWKIREMRRFPLMKTDIFLGWGKSRIVDPVPGGANKPDAPVPDADTAPAGLAMPAFLGTHPVTGKQVQPAGSAKMVAASALTGAIAAGKPASVTLEEAKRRLARSAAWDGIANVSSAYGYYLDDSMPAGFGGIMAKKGFKMTPFSGYYVGRDRVLSARVSGEPPKTRPGISYHWLVQPVILISDDGRSAVGRFRLFQPRTGKTVGKAGDFFGASFWGGMYHDQYVLEDGIWRIWELTLDEPYINPVAWKDGVWAKSKDPEPRPAACVQGRQLPARHSADRPRQARGGLPRRNRRDEGMADHPADVVPVHQSGERPRARALSGAVRALRGAPRAQARGQRLSEAAGRAGREQGALTSVRARARANSARRRRERGACRNSRRGTGRPEPWACSRGPRPPSRGT